LLAIFTGFDSAWYPGKTGAICDLVLEADSLRIAAPPIPATWDCALERVRQPAEIDLRVWAIDQPLVVANDQGCRPVDIDLMRALMRDFQVGAHTANLHRPPWQPGAPIWQFLQALEQVGYRQDPMAIPHATGGRFYFECYPHPALIGLFDLDRILKYKKRSYNEDDWIRLINSVRSLASEEFPIKNVRDYVPAGIAHSKTSEDMLDSIVCAYIAAYWWRFGVERSSLIGDLSSGYMVTPHNSCTVERLEHIFRGRMNMVRPGTPSPIPQSANQGVPSSPEADRPASIRTEPSKYDWIYFSNESKWNLDGFCEFVSEQKLIVRTIHNKARIPVPNVLQLKPGERILLVYKADRKPHIQLFACTIGQSPNPIRSDRHLFDAFSRIEGRFEDMLTEAGFDTDPVVGGFTGIYLSETEDLHRAEIDLRKPVPMMAIQRWADVFPESG